MYTYAINFILIDWGDMPKANWFTTSLNGTFIFIYLFINKERGDTYILTNRPKKL